MKRIRDVVLDVFPPDDKNVLWLDISKFDTPLLKFYEMSNWNVLSGGGGGGGQSYVSLDNPAYYLNSNTVIPLEAVSLYIDIFSSTNTSPIYSIPCTLKYFYVAIESSNTLDKVITDNNETITSNFVHKGNFVKDSLTYKLYEFHLSSDIPLNSNITISIK